MIHRRSALLALVAAVLAAGCAQVEHVATGDVVIRERLVVTTDRSWNQFAAGVRDDTPTWTQDGLTLDALRFYVALKDGALLAPTPAQPAGAKPLAFRSTMGARDVLGLFEQLYSRGGSTFTLTKAEPHPFIGQNGFRFEFESLRNDDNVHLAGVGWGAVRQGELYVITFTAPRLSFFGRHLPAAEAVARSARVKG